MGRLPFVNLSLVVFVATLLALQHSGAILDSGRSSYGSIGDNLARAPSPAATGITAHRAQPGAGLRIPLGYLADLWRKSLILKGWWLDYQTTYWERMRATGAAKAGLVEARFHVANAEALGAAMGDNQRAKIELDRADDYLWQTRPLIEPALDPAIDEIRKEIGAARITLDSLISADAECYERIKSALNQTIDKLRVA